MRILPAVLVALAIPAAFLYGCGGSVAGLRRRRCGAGDRDAHPEAGGEDSAADGGVDAAPDGDGYHNQAPHCVRTDAGIPEAFDAGAEPDVASLPQVVSFGGTTLHHPTIISVTFPSDTLADQLQDFSASVGCTDYWHAITADYGVGEAVAGPPVALTEKAPTTIDDSAIAKWLAAKVNSKDPQFPKPAADTIYALWYPESTTITLEGSQSCSGFGGYHNGTKLADGTPISYAVMPRCPQQGGTIIDGLHVGRRATSSSRPAPIRSRSTNPPTSRRTRTTRASKLAGASEVGDMCEFDQSAYYQPAGYSLVRPEDLLQPRRVAAGT